MNNPPVGYAVRLAVIRKVRKTKIECYYRDSSGDKTVECPIPYPYAGVGGGGIFAGVEPGTTVLLATGKGERQYVVGVIPERGLYFDQSGIPDAPFFTSEYPEVANGEVCLKSSVGSQIFLKGSGNIALDAGIGDSSSDIELSNLAKSLFMRTDNIYRFTEAGREIEGIIKRDKTKLESSEHTNVLDFLTGEVYSSILTDIGRSPKDEVGYRTTSISTKSSVRNPALVEKRSILYEYANSYGVRGLTFESDSMAKIDTRNIESATNVNKINPSSRENRRTDILDLNHRNFNHLIERVEGTVVDIYGNVLDINRNKIRIPEVEEFNTTNNIATAHSLRRAYAFLRRSIKYHLEINSRKELTDTEPSVNDPGYNAKHHSRWSIDVDGEGLTKINIPSSSETGNIPMLSRYIVSRNEEDSKRDEGQYRDSDVRDVRVLQFGAKSGSNFAGQRMSDSEYSPVSVGGDNVTAGTAYHDLFQIASSILSSGGKLRNPNPGSGAGVVPPMVEAINNTIPGIDNGVYDPSTNQDANAGGRSVHANLDGSLEMSIGADTADRKSIVLDLAGGVISHYGRDKNGRSLIHQTDGDVIIQVGGTGISDDRFNEASDIEDRPGRVEIHLNRPGSTSQKIIIDEGGITFDISGNGIFKTTGDLSIVSGGKLLLHGERILTYGSVDSSVDGTRSVGGGERVIARKGRHI